VNVADLEVRGMTCGVCVARVRAALLPIDGVQDVEIDLHSSRVRVTSASNVAPSHLIAALAARRYESSVVTRAGPSALKGDSSTQE